MKEIELLVFLKLHEEDLVSELREEFKIQIDTRNNYKGFRRIRFDEQLERKMRLALVDKCPGINAELRLSFLDEDSVKDIMDIIIQRSIND